MKHRAIKLLCVFTALLCMVTTALAADTGARNSQLYPVSVEAYTEGDFDELRIKKVCKVVTYTAIFGGEEMASNQEEAKEPAPTTPSDGSAYLLLIGMGAIVMLAVWLISNSIKKKERRT